MSALVDRRKRGASIFLDDPIPDSPVLSKRIRLSEAASFQLSPSSPPRPPTSADAVSHGSPMAPLCILRARFPDLDIKVVENVLQASGNNLDLAFKTLHEHLAGSQGKDLNSATYNSLLAISQNILPPLEDSMEGPSGGPANASNLPADGPSGGPANASNLPADGPGWVELLLRELTTASDGNDARARAASILELLQKTITAHASAKATETIGKENKMLKEQVESLLHDNGILKRAVAIQHERQKNYDAQNEELQQLKLVLVQCKEQMRILEINNYSLTLHLKEAQQGSSILGRFNPDVF